MLRTPPAQILVNALPLPVFRIYSAAIRGANNVVGGISFVTLARILGVQKARGKGRSGEGRGGRGDKGGSMEDVRACVCGGGGGGGRGIRMRVGVCTAS